jgi:hypothetical protein
VRVYFFDIHESRRTMLQQKMIRQGVSTRTRSGRQRFDAAPLSSAASTVTCMRCADDVPHHDSVLTAEGTACLRCDADQHIAASLDAESRELQLGLLGTTMALVIAAGAAFGTTWNLVQSAWYWAFVAWLAAQGLALWLGLYGARQGWDAIRTLGGLTDDGADAIDSDRRIRIRLLGQLAFWGGSTVACGSLISLVGMLGLMLTLAALG